MAVQSSARLVLFALFLLASRAAAAKKEETKDQLVTGMDKEHDTLQPQAGVTAASHTGREQVEVRLQGSKITVKVDKASHDMGTLSDDIFDNRHNNVQGSMGRCGPIASEAAQADPSAASMALLQSWNATPSTTSAGTPRQPLTSEGAAGRSEGLSTTPATMAAGNRNPLHVAAMNYDADEEVMWVGLNIKQALNLAPEALAICWCNGGAWLFMGCASYKITSIMHEGNSLCMGQCHMSQVIQENLKQNGTPDYTIQLKELPNAPFRIRTLSTNQDTDPSDGVLKVSVEFIEGDLGLMVPGRIGMSSKHGACSVPLGVYRGNEKIGCIKTIANSGDKVEVRQAMHEYKPKFREVTLTRGPQDSHSYALTNPEPHWEDNQMCLVKEMESLLRGGDAEITMCEGY